MNFEPEIKRGIPIPAHNSREKSKYHWLLNMKIGDCIDVPDHKTAQSIISSVYQSGIGRNKKKGPGRVKQRVINDNGQKIYRIWRVS